MYKRRDWLLTRGADGGGEETSTSSEGSDEDLGGDVSSSANEHSSNDEQESLERSDIPSDETQSSSDISDSFPSKFKRLEDISEDDLSDSGDEDGNAADEDGGDHAEELKLELKMQLQQWIETSTASMKGRPLRCMACGGSLLLNSRTFQQHLNSKKHIKASKSWSRGDVFEFASGRNQKNIAVVEEEAETHEERFMRSEAIALLVKAADAKGDVVEKVGRKKPRKGGSRKRPGKRQRKALKEKSG